MSEILKRLMETPENSEQELLKLNRHILKFTNISDEGIASDNTQETRFLPDGSIISTKNTVIGFTEDGHSSDPEYGLGKCTKGHIVNSGSLFHCSNCGIPICLKERKVYLEKILCPCCFYQALAKGAIKKLVKFFLAPFYEENEDSE